MEKTLIDDYLYEGTPDLILPPDFNKDPTTLKRTKKSTNQQISQENYKFFHGQSFQVMYYLLL